MSVLYNAPTINYVSKTLNGAINDSVTTITLNSTTNMQAPGYVVINRENSAGTATPNSREVVSYTGISGNDLTGCTRPSDGSTARSHADGSLVEAILTVGMWNSLATIVDTAVTTDGYLKAINSPVSIAIMRIGTRLEVSAASVTGLGLNPVFSFIGSVSGPTTLIQTPLSMPRGGTWRSVSFITRTVASGASAFIDINKNGTSIFNAGTRPTITGGGTYVSTASIATKAFLQGDSISWDMDTGAGLALHITDFNILLNAE